ncbi:hypothetical protein [Winogradskyella sp. SYSU M77433]|uniref:hypothetical protein n=1 Tax=Winogradskyella sp. SYSU M77433 TaxID=3042722 RepID=UPI00247FB469|nr:hypothetical protein [Winogradskyella sp. SYSU M77433]MDH7912416.1 hypothetical protein [Winogradskyella sp. SYSU M77433]
MLKRILIGIALIIIIFFGLLYWSTRNTEDVFSKSVVYNVDTKTVDFKNYDSVEIVPSKFYDANAIKELFQGEQYRDVWSTKIKVPIVFLDTLKGGMQVVEKGGGKQTHSLELLGVKDSVSYTIRSVNKDPQALVPEFVKTLGLENLIEDGISAQHPYAALLVAELSDKVELLHTKPQLIFVPKQEVLGEFNAEYGNRLFYFECETKSDKNWTHLNNVTHIIDTEDLQELKLELKDRLKIDKNNLIRHRLFDLIIGDWDRHTKQWGWAVQKKDSTYSAVAIASDRDNAFFNTEGLIPSVLSHKNVVEELRPFREDIDYMEGLVYPFDQYFLLNTPEADFIAEAKYLQNTLTDDVLNKALNVWPKQISDLDGDAIINKMKERRDDLVEYAKAFKIIIDDRGKLSEQLKGTDKEEVAKHLLECFECLK